MNFRGSNCSSLSKYCPNLNNFMNETTNETTSVTFADVQDAWSWCSPTKIGTTEIEPVFAISSTKSSQSSHCYRRQFKLLIVGDAGVGKTAFVQRHVTGAFEKRYVIPTTDVQQRNLSFHTNQGVISFDAWDCAGYEKFKGLRDANFSGADCAIIMFDVTARVTYTHVSKWYRHITKVCPNIPIVVVGNKMDVKMPKVAAGSISYRKDKYIQHLQHYDISTKSNYNFEMPFLFLARKMMRDEQLIFVEAPVICPPDVGLTPEQVNQMQQIENDIRIEEDKEKKQEKEHVHEHEREREHKHENDNESEDNRCLSNAQLLTTFYTKYNVGKIQNVPSLLQKYLGRMNVLFFKLERKYNANGFFSNLQKKNDYIYSYGGEKVMSKTSVSARLPLPSWLTQQHPSDNEIEEHHEREAETKTEAKAEAKAEAEAEEEEEEEEKEEEEEEEEEDDDDDEDEDEDEDEEAKEEEE
jgi:GTP-binding nuclear protein Ran